MQEENKLNKEIGEKLIVQCLNCKVLIDTIEMNGPLFTSFQSIKFSTNSSVTEAEI